jgi:hypothetical protein
MAGAASRPTARPRRARFIWAACSPSTGPMKTVIRCGTMNRRPMFPVSSPLRLSVRCCVRRRFAAAWAAPAKWWCLIDGAAGLENMGRQCFKDCLQIVDFFHAMEHAGHVLEALIGKAHPDYKKRLRRWAKRLLKDKIQTLIKETRQQSTGQPQAAAVEKTLGYFVRNVSRMQYGTFRAAGYFIGSGVVLRHYFLLAGF